jgi:hypothetical protein
VNFRQQAGNVIRADRVPWPRLWTAMCRISSIFEDEQSVTIARSLFAATTKSRRIWELINTAPHFVFVVSQRQEFNR